MRFRNSALGLALLLVLLAGVAPATQQDMERKVTESSMPTASSSWSWSAEARILRHLHGRGRVQRGCRRHRTRPFLRASRLQGHPERRRTTPRKSARRDGSGLPPDPGREESGRPRPPAANGATPGWTSCRSEAGEYVVNNEFVCILEKNGGVSTNAGAGMDATMYFVACHPTRWSCGPGWNPNGSAPSRASSTKKSRSSWRRSAASGPRTIPSDGSSRRSRPRPSRPTRTKDHRGAHVRPGRRQRHRSAGVPQAVGQNGLGRGGG